MNLPGGDRQRRAIKSTFAHLAREEFLAGIHEDELAEGIIPAEAFDSDELSETYVREAVEGGDS